MIFFLKPNVSGLAQNKVNLTALGQIATILEWCPLGVEII